MAATIHILCLIALVLALGLAVKLILSFHEKDEGIELDFFSRGGRKRYLFRGNSSVFRIDELLHDLD